MKPGPQPGRPAKALSAARAFLTSPKRSLTPAPEPANGGPAVSPPGRMIRFEDIHETVARHYPDADLEILRKAYIFSAVEHKGQTRASGEPYLVHPLEVAGILADMLHDVDLASGRPAFARGLGEHPDCGPGPAAARQFGPDFDEAKGPVPLAGGG